MNIRIVKRLAAVGAGAAVCLLYLLADPADHSWMPQCFFRHLTGLECPGCGAQRMLHALLHGDLLGAWGYNPFLLLMIPLLVFMGWLEMRRTRYPALYARFYSLPVIISIALSVVGWFLIRNFGD